MKETTIDALEKEPIINLIGKQWMLVTAGTTDDFNTMTASWGAVGELWNRPVAIIFIRPERYTHDFIEKNDRVTLSFFDENFKKALQICGSKSGREIDKVKETGLSPIATESGATTFSQARLSLDCRKLFKTDMTEDSFLDKSVLGRWYGKEQGNLHSVYILEIEKVYEQ